jgi:hypothetical protein
MLHTMSVLTHFIGWARYMTGPTHTQYWVGPGPPGPPRIDATVDYIWFGFNNTVLSWIESYLTHRTFYVNLDGTKSSVFQLCYCVRRGSVLIKPLLSILYITLTTTPKSAANHHLYADNTQLNVLNLFHNISNFVNTISLLHN